MNLNSQFNIFFIQKFGPTNHVKVLLTVSGGVDSMAMLHLFYLSKINFGVAHCNFSLRGNESNLDNSLVKNYCLQLNIPFYETTFNTNEIAKANKKGIQETARDLRYEWFEKTRKEYQYDFVATAHHADDNAETILFNLIRGTGIKGVSGIPIQTNTIIRPLLFASKSAIINFANEHNLPYRNDASNAENKYARNLIRNEVLPLLNSINSASSLHINNFALYSQSVKRILAKNIEQLKEKTVEITDDIITLNISFFIADIDAPFYLYELLTEYGFNASQVNEIHESFIDHKTGNTFQSASHQLFINRDNCIISRHTQSTILPEFTIQKNNLPFTCIINNTHYTFTLKKIIENLTFKDHEWLIDGDLISNDFHFRPWQAGDYFTPLGMNGHKKISDFLIDKKIDLLQKKEAYVLVSNTEIVAVIPYQISNKFKLKKTTQFALCIMMHHS